MLHVSPGRRDIKVMFSKTDWIWHPCAGAIDIFKLAMQPVRIPVRNCRMTREILRIKWVSLGPVSDFPTVYDICQPDGLRLLSSGRHAWGVIVWKPIAWSIQGTRRCPGGVAETKNKWQNAARGECENIVETRWMTSPRLKQTSLSISWRREKVFSADRIASIG